MERSKPGRRAAEDFSMAVAGALGPRLDRERFQWSSLLMLAPGLALLGGLFLGPVLYAFYIGFTNLALVGSRSRDYSFTGLENVTRMLGDYVFTNSAWLTIVFVVGSAIIGQSVLGMVLAILLRNAHFSLRAVIGSAVSVAW